MTVENTLSGLDDFKAASFCLKTGCRFLLTNWLCIKVVSYYVLGHLGIKQSLSSQNPKGVGCNMLSHDIERK
jgi:hypothetical protein